MLIENGNSDCVGRWLTIVIPVHLSNQHVIGMLESIKAQDDTDFEVIFVLNGHSNEKLFEIQKEIETILDKAKFSFKFSMTDKQGANPARRFGADLAIGEYVFFLDCDDQLASSNVLSKFKTIIDAHKPDILSTNLQSATIDGQQLVLGNRIYNYKKPDELLRFSSNVADVVHNYGTNICARFIRRELLKNLEFLNLPYCQDWNVSAKIFLRAQTFIFASEPSYLWVKRDNSASSAESLDLGSHHNSFNCIVDIHDFYKKSCVNSERTFFLFDRIVRFCFQHMIRGQRIGSNYGHSTGLKLVREVFQLNHIKHLNGRLLLMLLLLQLPGLHIADNRIGGTK
jgi:glycosyltransferase involved in cell wall biosynthesis